MPGKALRDALNRQIGNEMFSANSYLAMSSHCAADNLEGAASWLRTQYREELEHAMKFVEFIESRGDRAEIPAVERPAYEFDSLLAVFEAALAQERRVTGQINALYAQALGDDDYPAQVFLQWFVTEQVEEEQAVIAVIEKLRMAGDDSASLLMIDRDLGSRTG